MPLSISRKVFLLFLVLTVLTLFMGTTINFSLQKIVANEERIRALYTFMNLLSEIGHFHSAGKFHLSFHENTPRFKMALNRLQELGGEISTWGEYHGLTGGKSFSIAEQASHYRSAAEELLAEKHDNEAITGEINRLSMELRDMISSHHSEPNSEHSEAHWAFDQLGTSPLDIYGEIDIATISRLKDLQAETRGKIENRGILSLIDHTVLAYEKKYLSQLAIADREDFLSETGRIFYDNAGKIRDHISLTTAQQEKKIRSLVILVVLLTALATLVLWLLATRRIRRFTRNFSYSIESIEKGDYRYDLPHIVRDELGEALLFAKKLSLGLEEKIAQQEETEQERERLQNQLFHAQKMESVGRLAGGIAHDFNNLLMGITGYCELALLTMEKDHHCRGYLKGILESGEKAGALTAQLLTFSRKQILEKRSLDLNDIIAEQGKMLDRMIGEDIALELDLEENIGRVFGDPGQIAQVFMNLAINARDSMPRGGRLKITTAAVTLDEGYTKDHVGLDPGEYVQVAVMDNGEGMSRAVQERAFEPFFTTKEIGKGTGLGLATVFGIVRQHGGHVWLYSEEGEGTTIKVYFPASDEEGPQAVEDQGEEEVPRGSETVLVVDDNADVLDVVGKALTLYGYTLLSAGGGSAALDLLKNPEVAIDLLLTDVVMPGMNGRELAEKARALRPRLKVIFMSGHADRVLLPEDISAGADTNLLQKPVMPTFLLRKIRNVLNEDLAQGGNS